MTDIETVFVAFVLRAIILKPVCFITLNDFGNNIGMIHFECRKFDDK